MADSEFPHLPLIHKFRGDAQLEGGGEKSNRVRANETRRAEHGKYLADSFGQFAEYSHKRKEERKQAGLPEVSGGDAFLLQIPEKDDGVFRDLQTLDLANIFRFYLRCLLRFPTHNNTP